jgi:zinc transport system substrate-binding protein
MCERVELNSENLAIVPRKPFDLLSKGLPEILSGAEESRTPDLVIANDALYQLSYRPGFSDGRSIAPEPRGVSELHRQGRDGGTDFPSVSERVRSEGRRFDLKERTMRGRVIAAAALLGTAAIFGVSCDRNKHAPAGGKPAAGITSASPPVLDWSKPLDVVVSIPPLKGLVEPLLPPGSTVTVLIRPGSSEHGYEIPPADLMKGINAGMLVWIGGMEPAVDALSRENARPGRTDVRLADALGIEVEEDHDHDHGSGAGADHMEHEHTHGGENDPHVWLDPQQAVLIVRAVGAKVAAVRPVVPGGKATGAPGAVEEMVAKLNALDQEYREGLVGARTRTIVVGHDAYGWLVKRYDLKTVAISGLTAGEPTLGDLQKAKEAVRANGLKAVFSEPQLSPSAAKSIADETGVEVKVLDPLGDGDYFKMMRANLEAIKSALGVRSDRK